MLKITSNYFLGSLVGKTLKTNEEWNEVLSELEDILDYKFKNIVFLKEALIHPS